MINIAFLRAIKIINRPVPGEEPRVRPRPWRRLLVLIIIAVFFHPGWAAAGADTILEDLNYRVDALLFQDAVRARLTLKSLGNGKYEAEISGSPQGALKSLTGERRDSYQTEMAWRQGRLLPVVHREESRRQGKVHLKEYRFDYARGKLEMWQLKEGKGMVLKWQTTLKEPIYDPLSAFYNCRLGLLGPIRDGQVFKLRGIPYPKPEEVEVRIGPETAEGRKTMITLAGQAHKKKPGPVFAFLDGQMVPRHAWTRVLGIGKITGELLPGGKGLRGLTPEVAAGQGLTRAQQLEEPIQDRGRGQPAEESLEVPAIPAVGETFPPGATPAGGREVASGSGFPDLGFLRHRDLPRTSRPAVP